MLKVMFTLPRHNIWRYLLQKGQLNEVDRSVEDLMYGSTETNDVATTALAAIGKDHRS